MRSRKRAAARLKQNRWKAAVCAAVCIALMIPAAAFAEEYIPQESIDEGGKTIISVEVTDEPPMNLSVTVPLTLPIAMRLAGGADGAPELYWPTDGTYSVTNTSLNYTDETKTERYPVTLRVKELRVSRPVGAAHGWSLAAWDELAAPARENAFQMALRIGGTALPAYTAADSGYKTVKPTGALAQDIPQDYALSLNIEAKAGGLRPDYQDLTGTETELFRVAYILEWVPEEATP